LEHSAAMPRANRYIVAGPVFHVTHRCHNRDYLFRFARDRDAYRSMMREQLERHSDVRLLTYCITSNHIHLLLTSRATDTAISNFMQALQGQYAQAYNRRKKRSGAFWENRYHATMIDSGEYLWRCMRYIDLNMVRAGVVKHPSQWTWSGYAEISGQRKRYRTINLDELCERTSQGDLSKLQSWYSNWIDAASSDEIRSRNGQWTENIAVGGKVFIEMIGASVEDRMKVEISADGNGSWMVREEQSAYSPFSA
jgi:putative transposase